MSECRADLGEEMIRLILDKLSVKFWQDTHFFHLTGRWTNSTTLSGVLGLELQIYDLSALE